MKTYRFANPEQTTIVVTDETDGSQIFVPTDPGVATLFNPLAQPSQRMPGGNAAPLGPAHDDLPGHPRGPPLAG